MYALVRHLNVREALLVEAPSLAMSLLIAEFCYKFHSFVLECSAFLVTWLAISYVAGLATRLWPLKERDRPSKA